MEVEHAVGQKAFCDGLTTFMEVVEALDDVQLMAASRCRGWNAGDVIVHVHLGLQDMLLGLVTPTGAEPTGAEPTGAEPTGAEPTADAASYWRTEVPTNDAGSDQVSQVRFVRLLGAAYRRPTGIVGHLRPTARALSDAVSELAPGTLRFQGHSLRSGDFLATWAVELAIHHLDLNRELEIPPPASSALDLARRTVEALVGGRLPSDWDDVQAVLIGAGRMQPDPYQARQVGHLVDRLPALG